MRIIYTSLIFLGDLLGERRKNEIIAKNIPSFLFEHSFVASGLIEIQKNKKP